MKPAKYLVFYQHIERGDLVYAVSSATTKERALSMFLGSLDDPLSCTVVGIWEYKDQALYTCNDRYHVGDVLPKIKKYLPNN